MTATTAGTAAGARALMVQGTASSVGKSLLVTALCRLFRRDGVRVAPFKSQNMSLNACVTPDGRELGRAQAVQAEAAGAPLSVDMNPILLKPEGAGRSQVVILGKAIGSLTPAEYHAHKAEFRAIIAESLARLRAAYDLVVIEGAGSPAEINLKEHDVANMHVARLADAPVILVGDIDRGGVFASLVGTMELLDRSERARVAGFVINKFRGDVGLLGSGLTSLTARTGVPVLGVLPFIEQLGIADEDGVALDDRARDSGRLTVQPRGTAPVDLLVAVVRLPRISNHDEVQPLEYEPGVRLRFVESAEEIAAADLVILPGSKSTVADLQWLRERGLDRALGDRIAGGGLVLGICGGCQMLGQTIDDPDGVESPEAQVAGLGFLPLRTRFQTEKTVAQVKASVGAASFLTAGLPRGTVLTGYEIHSGLLEAMPGAGAAAPFRLRERNRAAVDLADGAVGPGGAVVGTLIHGLLENDPVRAALLATLRLRRSPAGQEVASPAPSPSSSSGRRSPDAAYDRLADVVRDHLDWPLVRRLAGLSP